ncbi:MarR family transcriptional regulator [Streptomyces sp. B8F3]|uniref:GbsR/MarR family transcriptional regulator n=1 Tax=unclassified Streptomyces TaxID=2593676 RepID=UPI00325F227A
MADQHRDGGEERGDGAERDIRAGRDAQAVERYVERVAAELTEMGMQRMASRVFACILADDTGALTAAEVGERLHVSPAAVSGAVRYLGQVGLIARERERGSRRERYRVEGDRWYQIFAQREQSIRHFQQTLLAGIGVLGAETPAGRRIEETAEFFAFLREENGRLEQRWWDYVKRRDEARAAGE